MTGQTIGKCSTMMMNSGFFQWVANDNVNSCCYLCSPSFLKMYFNYLKCDGLNSHQPLELVDNIYDFLVFYGEIT